MSNSWPTEPQTTSEEYETAQGNTGTVRTTQWPAGIIHLATEAPEPPGGYG
jgi:hypothetical protein